jgi:hypothetical protein
MSCHGSYFILPGDVREILSGFPPAHFDACLCDPPYLLEFMGKEFDRQHKAMAGANDGQRMQAWHETWAREVLRVLKPGAHMLAFGGTRTYHRLASAMEDVGFEVRDTLCWLHGQGFPKGKTQLKPAHEPIVLARKSGRSIRLDINSCRIGTTKDVPASLSRSQNGTSLNAAVDGSLRRETGLEAGHNPNIGRWPANLLLSHHPGCVETDRTITPPRNGSIRPQTAAAATSRTGPNAYSPDDRPRGEWEAYQDEVRVWECHPDCPVRMLDEQSGVTKSRASGYNFDRSNNSNAARVTTNIKSGIHFDDSGGASRFFATFNSAACWQSLESDQTNHPKLIRFRYTAKVSTRERNLGGIDCKHPTLKPLTLTTYLSRLLLPPAPPDTGSTSASATPRRLLIPFSGAGSEIAGALIAGWDEVIGIEREAEYIEWAEARIPAALALYIDHGQEPTRP